jgi:hypothetical protein
VPESPRDTIVQRVRCLQDFLDWAHHHHVKIAEAHVFAEGKIRPLQDGDNLYAEQCLLAI